MIEQLAMFDMPSVPVAVEMSPTRRRTERRRQLLAAGIHPATRRPLGAVGQTCGDCSNLRAHETSYPPRRFYKCALMPVTNGPATDLRVSWPACELFDPTGSSGGAPAVAPPA